MAFDNKLRGRKNFTLMHEGSHQIFKMLFPNDYGVTQKSSGVHYYKVNSERNKPISDWEEWQANTLGAAILLPGNLIKQGMFLFNLGDKIECLNKIYSPEVYKRFEALADFLGCSKKALAIRMKQLGLLKKEYLDNPFDIINIYPEGCKVSDEEVTAFVELRVTPQGGDGYQKLQEKIKEFSQVVTLYLMSGAYDFLVMVRGKNLKPISSLAKGG